MSDVEIKEKEIKKEELKIKNKKWKLIIIIATAIVGALGGSTYEEKKIYKNINSSVIGDGNVVSFNNVDEFIKDYQKTIQDNEKLNDQNTEYYKNYVEIKEQNELLKNQLMIEVMLFIGILDYMLIVVIFQSHRINHKQLLMVRNIMQKV